MLQYLLALISTKLPKSEKGQDLAEYALLIGLIAIFVILAVTALGTEIDAIFGRIVDALQAAVIPAAAP